MDTRQQLVDMGFAPNRIETALRNVPSGSLEDCIEWIEANQAKFDAADEQSKARLEEEGNTIVEKSETGETGDLTGTDNDTPKAPLSDEEKKAKLELLRQKADIRKAEAAKRDAEEEKKNELIRRKHTTESIRATEDLKKKEALQEAARRRREAREDVEAKKRIKDLIEADRRARAEKRGSSSSSPVPVPAPAAAPAAPKAPRTYNESKLRFRIQGIPGAPGDITKTYPVATTLEQVAADLSPEVGVSADSLVFMTTFPTKMLTKPQFGQTLTEAGLINASVILKRA